VILNLALACLALLSIVLLIWQWLAARKFPLHKRITVHGTLPAVTLLKPLKGVEPATADCLRSWLRQDYPGTIQVLFAVASHADPVCELVTTLMKEHPGIDAELVVVEHLIGPNAKVSKLAELEQRAKHDVFVVSDADVRVPADFLQQVVSALGDSKVGLVNCFYRLANPSTLPMQWESIAINADFWSQVLQSRMLKPLDFALGAVMVTHRRHVQEIGGFKSLADCLADDYQLGHRIAKAGGKIALSEVVVECWDAPMSWRAVWKHQLRWARTIRVCQPIPYFFSILSNPLLWALIWVLAVPQRWSWITLIAAVILRAWISHDLQRRLNRSNHHAAFVGMTPLKDLLQVALWFFAFAGNTVEWRGRKFRLRADGTLEEVT